MRTESTSKSRSYWRRSKWTLSFFIALLAAVFLVYARQAPKVQLVGQSMAQLSMVLHDYIEKARRDAGWSG